MYNETITFYSKNPPNKQALEDFTVKYYEDNNICWDDLEVYLKIQDNVIKAFWFTGETAIITTACASILWESIIWVDVDKVLEMNYSTVEELIWMEVSPRRKQASVLWLLTTRNAIHQYLQDWLKDEFDDIL